ncbi:UNVERIFIED_CONTAM: hypothetical protein FKN15_050672 [Acipenser sinensis]
MEKQNSAAILLLKQATTLNIHTGNLVNWSRLKKKCPSSTSEELQGCIRETLSEWCTKIAPTLEKEAPSTLECTLTQATEAITPEEREELKVSACSTLGVSQLDSVMIAPPPLPEGVSLTLEHLQPYWEELENLLQSHKIAAIGTSDLDKPLLEQLYMWAQLDSVMIVPPPLPEGVSLTLEHLQPYWEELENLLQCHKIAAIGTSDLDKPLLEQLYMWAQVKPSSNQVNLASCCVMPPDLTAFAKEYDIQLLTHNDSNVQATDNPRATRSLRSRAVSKAKPGAKSQNEDTEFSEAESCSTVTSYVQASQNQRTAKSRRSEALSLNAEKSQNEDTEVSEAESWCSGLKASIVRRTTRSRQVKGQPASESHKKGVTEVEKCSLPSPSKDPEVAVCREQSTSSPKSTRRTSRRNISQSQQEEVISCPESESIVSSVAGSPTRGSCRVESRSEVVSETPSSSRTGSRRNRRVVSQPETTVEAPSDHEEMELELPVAASPRKEETKPSEERKENIQKTADSEGPGLHNSETVIKNEEQIISELETTASHEKVEVNDETIVIELDCESINIELADGKSKQGKESVSGYKDADTDSEDENQNQRCRNLLNLDTIKASPKQPQVINLLFSSDEDSDSSDRDDSEEEMDDNDVICIPDGEPGPSKPRPSEKHSTQEDGLFVIDTQPGFEPSRKYYLESGTKDSEEEEEAESDKEGDQGKESEEEFIDEEDDEEAEVLYKRRKPALMELSCSIDPGLNLKDIGGLYISFDAKKHKSAPSALKKLKEQKNKDVLLEKSVITPDFEKKESVPPYKESLHRLKMKRREERAKTTGDGWYNMKAPEMTNELKNDLKALKMRSAMDPKRFYKKNDREGFPKYLQVSVLAFHARYLRFDARALALLVSALLRLVLSASAFGIWCSTLVHAPRCSTLRHFDTQCTHLDARRFGARRSVLDAPSMSCLTEMSGFHRCTSCQAKLPASDPHDECVACLGPEHAASALADRAFCHRCASFQTRTL